MGIRTFWVAATDGRVLRFGTGAGITWGSRPRAGVAGDRAQGGSAGRARVWQGRAVTTRAWVERTARRRGRARPPGQRPRPDRRGRRLRDGKIVARRGVRADPAPQPAGRARPPAWDLPEPDLDRIRAGVAELLAAEDPIEFGRLRITVTGGAGPLGSERVGRRPAPVSCRSAAQAPPPPTSAVVRRAVGPQRAQRRRRDQDHVVRRERRRARLRQGSGRLRGPARQHAGRPLRGHRQQRVRRARRASWSPRPCRPGRWPGISRGSPAGVGDRGRTAGARGRPSGRGWLRRPRSC